MADTAAMWMLVGAAIGTVVTLASCTFLVLLVRRLIPIPDGPRSLPPGIPRVEEIHLDPPAPKPKKELPSHVYEAFADYVNARLAANGNQGVPVKQLLTEFARWHGPFNLDRGILRPKPPPIPEEVLAPRIEEEC